MPVPTLYDHTCRKLRICKTALWSEDQSSGSAVAVRAQRGLWRAPRGGGHVHTCRATRLHSEGRVPNCGGDPSVQRSPQGQQASTSPGAQGKRPFTVYTDASTHAWSATPASRHPDARRPRHPAPLLGTGWNDFQPWALIPFPKPRPWRRQWHPIPVLLPGKSHGQRSLVGCSSWGC